MSIRTAKNQVASALESLSRVDGLPDAIATLLRLQDSLIAIEAEMTVQRQEIEELRGIGAVALGFAQNERGAMPTYIDTRAMIKNLKDFLDNPRKYAILICSDQPLMRLVMGYYWVTFEDGNGACVDAISESTAMVLGESHIEPFSRAVSAKVLPYPALPRIGNHDDCPEFCFKPKECGGHTACPRNYACSE